MIRSTSTPTSPSTATCGCPEGRAALSRRGFLTLAGGGVATATTLGGARVAFAAPTEVARDTLVVLSLRGGMDGLSVVVPAGDDNLYTARPGIAVPASVLKKVDPMFGLHPALAPIFPLWDQKKVAAVHAVGQQDANRSHFAAMDEMERAAPGSHLRTGWLDRAVGVAAGGLLTGTAVGSSTLPRSMAGPSSEFGFTTLDGVTLAFGEDTSPLEAWRQSLDTLHEGATNPMATAPVRHGVAAVAAVSDAPAAGGGYPDGHLASALRDVARLVKADVGMTLATVDYGDWDMHAGLGKPQGGWMADKLTELATALAAFAADLGDDFGRVTVVTLSEFGRRVDENGSGGTDHGYGNAVLLLGGAVNGGRVFGEWPGLGDDALVDGDLAVRTDYRQLLAELLDARCGLPTAEVFPGMSLQPLEVVRRR